MGSQQHREREEELAARIRQWLGRYWPFLATVPIVVRFRVMHNPNLQGFHLWDGHEHHFVLNSAFVDSPLLDAIVAHEVGHLVDCYRKPRLPIRIRRWIRAGPARPPDSLDTWLDVFTGVYTAQELFADACALRVLREEGLEEDYLLRIITLPRHTVQSNCAKRGINTLTRWLAVAHYHLRTRRRCRPGRR